MPLVRAEPEVNELVISYSHFTVNTVRYMIGSDTSELRLYHSSLQLAMVRHLIPQANLLFSELIVLVHNKETLNMGLPNVCAVKLTDE